MTNKDTEICNCYPGGPIRLPKGIHPEHRTAVIVTGPDANPTKDDHGKDDQKCTCYPHGSTPDTYEGPQRHCPIHGNGDQPPGTIRVTTTPQGSSGNHYHFEIHADDHEKDDQETECDCDDDYHADHCTRFSDQDQLSEETFGLPESLSIHDAEFGEGR